MPKTKPKAAMLLKVEVAMPRNLTIPEPVARAD
jgi:hypothetical protein